MVDHPLFGRADEDPARAAILERQMQRFLDAIQTEFDRLDDFLPPMTDGQSAEDWNLDLRRACEPILESARDLGWALLRADGWHKKHPAAPHVDRAAILEDLLDRCAEFIDGQVDVQDGDYGEPEPNKAMRLMTAIREVVPESPALERPTAPGMGGGL